MYLASETFKVLARRKPAPTAEESVLHKAAFPWREALVNAKSSLPLNFQEENLLRALNSASVHLLPPEFTPNQ